MNERVQRYTHHFQEGGRRDAENNMVQLFSDMLYLEKKAYVEDVLYDLLKKNPNDPNLAFFVAIGKRELLCDVDGKKSPIMRNSADKLYRFSTTVLLSLCLLLSPSPQITIPKNSYVSHNSHQPR